MSLVEKRDQLLRQIEAAFSNTPRPDDLDIDLLEAHGATESAQVARHFRGRRWQDVDLAFLETYVGDESAALAFMPPHGFRYYLPAFMCIALKQFNEADALPRALILALTIPNKDKRHYQRAMARVEGLAIEEKKAVRNFLAFMVEAHCDHFPDDEPRLALESYWSTA